MKNKTYSLKFTRVQINIIKSALLVYMDSKEFKRICSDCEKRLIQIVSQIKNLEEKELKNYETN